MKLDGIVCCTNYDDYLSFTLKENIKHFDSFVVVTDEEDIATQSIIREEGAICVIRSSKEPFDANGTKGAAINEGLSRLKEPQWLIHMDADIILPDTFRQNLEASELSIDKLYWVERKQPEIEQQLVDYFSNKETISSWAGTKPAGSPDRWSGPYGYFQLFHAKAKALEPFPTIYPDEGTSQEWLLLAEKGVDFSWSENKKVVANCTDGVFNQRWDKNLKQKLDNRFTVLHLPHGPSRVNWSGRKSARFSFPGSPPGFFS